MNKFKFGLSLLLGFASLCAQSQCIVINEIMINGAGPNDGQNSPYTEEWIELYNTCSEPVDLSCYVLADGDFSITIPFGTVMQANSYYTLGSMNAGFPVTLDWATCSCTSGSTIGIFTNGNEQLILTNGTGVLQDAIYWGGGQFPVNNMSAAIAGCSPVSINYNNADSNFEQIGSGGGQGCALARSCDGGASWVQRCGTTITPNITNSEEAVSVNFSGSELTICAGECINFTDQSSVNPISWNWTFEGSNATTSANENPAGICYDTPGDYDVSLQVSTACGSYSFTQPAYIHVTEGTIPEVTANGPLEFCEGGSVVLETTGAGPFQWYLDNGVIPGATSGTYEANVAGTYTVELTSGTCGGTSEPVIIIISESLTAEITPLGPITICEGENAVLAVVSTYDSYQWQLDGGDITGAEGQEYYAVEPGDYSVLVTDGTCDGASQIVTVSMAAPLSIIINEGENIEACNNTLVLLSTEEGLSSYQWYFNSNIIDGANTYSYEASEEGVYSVEANTAGNCPGTAETNITHINVPQPVIQSETGSFSACIGQDLTLFVEGDFQSCQWYLNDDLLWGETSPSVTITEDGNYSVVVFIDACSNTSDEVVVQFLPSPIVTITPGEDTEVCDEELLLTAVSNGSYQWMYNGEPIPGATSASYLATLNGSYSVFSSFNAECTTLSDEIDVLLSPIAEVEIITSTANPCEGETVTLSINDDYDTILWSTEESTDNIEVTTEGIYSVLVESGSCTSEAALMVLFAPMPSVNAGQDTVADCDLGVMLMGSGTGNLEWQNDESIANPSEPVTMAYPEMNTVYTLSATLGNCIAYDDIVVEVDCGSIFIPNVFTPNGDGKNDVFEIQARGIAVFDLKIFNRWGEVIFETDNPEHYWTGGKHDFYAPDGTYFYTVVALDQNNKSLLDEAHSHGTVTLLR